MAKVSVGRPGDGPVTLLAALGAAWSLMAARTRGRRRAAAAFDRATGRWAARFEEMVRHSSDLVLLTDRAGTVTYGSPAALRILGIEAGDLVDTAVTDLVVSHDRDTVLDGLRRASLVGDSDVTVELRVVRGDGSPRVLECRVRQIGPATRLDGLVWNVRDVTDRRVLGLDGAHRALHDALTDLPNRLLMLDRLHQAMDRASRRGSLAAVVLIDIDNLAGVNESHGHAAGNEVIVTMAQRLRESVRPEDTVARIGGDEFALVLDGTADLETVIEITERALALVAEPISASGRSIAVTATGGVATNALSDPRDGAPGLMRDAHTALYVARREAAHSYVVFEESLRGHAPDPLDLAVALDSATEAGQIEVYYQPLIHLETGLLEGFEALARWHHPTRGLVSPMAFIPVAEDTGAIHDIGRHVLLTACAQTSAWNQQAGSQLRISVNVSPLQLAEDEIIGHVQQALAKSGLAPQQLILEMTESALVHDLASVQRRLQGLRVMGVRIAMDDFGTGYSSLAYLRSLPLDIVKIDKSFIDDEIGPGPALLSNVTAMGTALGLDTVAEGIEDPDQLARARAAGCTYGQGYLIARPMDLDAATDFLAHHAAGHPA